MSKSSFRINGSYFAYVNICKFTCRWQTVEGGSLIFDNLLDSNSLIQLKLRKWIENKKKKFWRKIELIFTEKCLVNNVDFEQTEKVIKSVSSS